MTFNRFDQVTWERDGGRYSGMVAEVRPRFCRVMPTGGGLTTIYTEDLELVFPASGWDRDALNNHLQIVYGVTP